MGYYVSLVDGFRVKILSQCVQIVDAPLTRLEKLDALFDCVKKTGVRTHSDLMDIFDLGLPLLEKDGTSDRRNLHQRLMTAQAQFIAKDGLQTPHAKELLEEFYIELLYECPEYMWFEQIKHQSLLKPIDSKDWCHVFDNCQNAEKLAAVLAEGLFNVDEEIFGAQSWLTTSLAQSANVFALRGFGQSLRHLLCNFNEEEFCSTVQIVLEEMAQYGLYTHVSEHDPKTDFFVELFDHNSVFNQLLPVQARVNHRSMLQRLDLLLHDVNALDAEVMKLFLPALKDPYPSILVVQSMGGYLSDLWSNTTMDCIPTLPIAGDVEWPAPIFDHLLEQLSTDERLKVLYMALGRMRPKNSLLDSSLSVVAHLPWINEAWALRSASLIEHHWDEHEGSNLCNFLVPVRSQAFIEEWITTLLTCLQISATDAAKTTENLSATTNVDGLLCTPWPQKALRNHPWVQQHIIALSMPNTNVPGVKKM